MGTRSTGPALEAHYRFLLWLVPTVNNTAHQAGNIVQNRPKLTGMRQKVVCSLRLSTGLVMALICVAALHTIPTPATAQGLIREPEPVYRAFPVTPTYRAYLPPEVDLSAHLPPPGNQGQQGSCTAWAVGYGLRSYYEGKREGWDLKQNAHQVSPAAVYNLLHDNNNCQIGTSISDALNLLKNRGAVSLSELPYDPNSCSTRPQQTDSRWRIDDWQRVDTTRPDDIKGEIANGNPVVFGMDINTDFNTLKAGKTYDDTTTSSRSGHAMIVVGYSDVRQAFKIQNSWGPWWGDNGLGWVSYRAFAKLSDRAFVMRVSTPAPAPIPVPAPPPLPMPVPHMVIPEPTPVPVPSVRSTLEDEIHNLSCAHVRRAPPRWSSFVTVWICRQHLRSRPVAEGGGQCRCRGSGRAPLAAMRSAADLRWRTCKLPGAGGACIRPPTCRADGGRHAGGGC
ncbi:MAG: C1 family peptidase [Alphaproteobacteria bacterium]|nr:C1 family peptidase [Alphaproteobacteria bacterium]